MGRNRLVEGRLWGPAPEGDSRAQALSCLVPMSSNHMAATQQTKLVSAVSPEQWSHMSVHPGGHLKAGYVFGDSRPGAPYVPSAHAAPVMRQCTKCSSTHRRPRCHEAYQKGRIGVSPHFTAEETETPN